MVWELLVFIVLLCLNMSNIECIDSGNAINNISHLRG